MKNARPPSLVSKEQLTRDRAVFYFKRDVKFGSWMKAFVRDTQEHLVLLSSKPDHSGLPIKAAYEDIRLIPSTSLLQELDEIGYIFPRSHSILDENQPEPLPDGEFNKTSDSTPHAQAPIDGTPVSDDAPPCQNEIVNNPSFNSEYEKYIELDDEIAGLTPDFEKSDDNKDSHSAFI